MTDHIDINLQNWEERAAIHARDVTGDYMLDRFRAGEDSLHAIESAELGDISGKRVLHLQCHIGLDTFCLARRGAAVTGLDFSGSALAIARRLSEETGIKADFVQGTVDQAADLTPGPFDLVFTTWGTICWLPHMAIWAKVIASVLAPGGELYFADAHPAFAVLEDSDGRLAPTYDFQTPADIPLRFVNETTYTGDPTILSHQSTREWIHSLSAVLGGANRCWTDDNDVSRARSLALAGFAGPGARVRTNVASSRGISANSAVVLLESEKDCVESTPRQSTRRPAECCLCTSGIAPADRRVSA
ncbi:hypothetical protein AYJ54_34915 [Bradyrhizobium centrolobii]|uniref:Methyltransferase domain-containing protein n=1 Tax=Bradyrhizobium centrolobii TaxID=1505087 RepID=A0A176Y861_9BRAD|nr:class I SAM-dependent methyltransferase [Bradyrhizobium centrolobii]OAE97300.1 hypothetical protein AYJ54_34915 [Bradyrhizobium centrolobii]